MSFPVIGESERKNVRLQWDYIQYLPNKNIMNAYPSIFVCFLQAGIFAHPIYSKIGDYPELVRFTVDKNSRKQGLKKSRLPKFTKEEVKLIKGKSKNWHKLLYLCGVY